VSFIVCEAGGALRKLLGQACIGPPRGRNFVLGAGVFRATANGGSSRRSLTRRAGPTRLRRNQWGAHGGGLSSSGGSGEKKDGRNALALRLTLGGYEGPRRPAGPKIADAVEDRIAMTSRALSRWGNPASRTRSGQRARLCTRRSRTPGTGVFLANSPRLNFGSPGPPTGGDDGQDGKPQGEQPLASL